jgi:hypothetical protein
MIPLSSSSSVIAIGETTAGQMILRQIRIFFFHALNFYFDKGFTYIEIGDGEELWENRYFEDIRKAHSHIYWKLSQFYEDHRLYALSLNDCLLSQALPISVRNRENL